MPDQCCDKSMSRFGLYTFEYTFILRRGQLNNMSPMNDLCERK